MGVDVSETLWKVGGGGELSRCYEECKRLQSHSNGLDEHELRSVNYLASITVIEVRHTTVMH